MDSLFFALIILDLVIITGVMGVQDKRFDENYAVTWGNEHVKFVNEGRDIQLSMDPSSGAGFASKLSYRTGFFHMRIKLPAGGCAGVVTAFYLHSHTNKHDELDFEFLGNQKGKPITLQTNVFSNGQGNREQRVILWFDPTADFHNYQILWNEHQIVFYVDDVPIRVFKNNTSIGVNYPSQAMKIEASLWNGEDWATDGGRTKIDWSLSPFRVQFQDFNIDGCSVSTGYQRRNKSITTKSTDRICYSSEYWWNAEKYRNLTPKQQEEYENVRAQYMNYDYCSDRNRYPVQPPECESNI
ncbi:xyloglucan endotransglucosylase/hydrolase protein 2-like isoform X2 [Apium graveolens]|uniref:xyloglucan endotransglucosylase/hydrolase protein 2-like isoform X2 n=1 Tax=Apium graveolens TaxID=4045 RepID=UPI003D79E675